MEHIVRKEYTKFCDDFTYHFVSSECMQAEFKNLTCGDAQNVREHLYNSLIMNLRDWLEEKGIEIED